MKENRDFNFGQNKPPLAIVPKSTNFFDMDPTEVARQLTLYEHYLFRQIHPKECLNKCWLKTEKSDKAPNITAMSNHFNKIASWIVYEIVNQSNLINRVRTVKRFLKIAVKCREFNNFNCCQEIIAGLGSASVHRLKQTWSKLKKTEHKLMLQWDNIKEIMANNKSYSRYRTELKTCDVPCLPYLGVFLTDLTFIEDGNLDYLLTKDNRTDILNFAKMRKVASVIEKMLLYQPQQYNFEKVPIIYDYFQTLPQIDDTSAYEISTQLEPKSS